MSYILLEKVMIECPICGDTHLVEKRQRTTTAKIKDEIVEYVEMYYVCTEDGEAFEFTPAKMMEAPFSSSSLPCRVF